MTMQIGGTVALLSDGGELGLPDIGYDALESFERLQTLWEAEVQRRLDNDGRGYVVTYCEIGPRAFDRAHLMRVRDGATPSGEDWDWDEAESINNLIEGALEVCAHEVDKWLVPCEVLVDVDHDYGLQSPTAKEFFYEMRSRGFSKGPGGALLQWPVILHGHDAQDFYEWCRWQAAWRAGPFGVTPLSFDNVCPPVMHHDDEDVRHVPRVVWGYAKR